MRYGRITDPRHIDGPSLDPPDDDCCPHCECDDGRVPCEACEGKGGDCEECENGTVACDCRCHSAPDDSYDEDAAMERRYGRQSW